MMWEAIFYIDTDKKIEEAGHLQKLNSVPAIHQTLRQDFRAKAFGNLPKKIILASTRGSQLEPISEEFLSNNRAFARTIDAFDRKKAERLKKEKNYDRIVLMLKRAVIKIESYGIDTITKEYKQCVSEAWKLDDVKTFRKNKERYRKIIDILSSYGIALKEKGELYSAFYYLQLVTELDGFNTEAYHHMAAIHEKNGNMEKAQMYYRAAGNMDKVKSLHSKPN
jgi:hypothetical protein